MRTPTIAFTPTPQQLGYYDREGRSRQLEICQDGRLEASFGSNLQDGFVSDLSDARLAGEQLGAAQLGKGWTYTYSGGEKLRFGSGQGDFQELTSQQKPDGSRLVSVRTLSEQGEHCMSAVIKNGAVQPETVRENAQIEVSPAGLNVLRDGKVLFEMPSAFGGGCTW